MLVEFHLLQNHAPSNLNRDDTGSPKDAVFGGVRRARISSQALKRAMRQSPWFQEAFADGLAFRTRKLPDLVKEALLAKGMTEEMAAIGAQKASGFGNKDGKEAVEPVLTAQMMFVTPADVEAVSEVILASAAGLTAAQFAKVSAKELQAHRSLRQWRPITPDVALFGRMITSEGFRDVEAAAQVAHALSTHKMDHEFDFFTAVDDLKNFGTHADDDEAGSRGAGMVGDVEYTSACYYKYASVDITGLHDNLSGGRNVSDPAMMSLVDDMVVRAVTAMLKAMVFTTPSGKQNTFAAHQLPDAILVEVRPVPTPVSYANAFVDPVRRGDKGVVDTSIAHLIRHAETLTTKFSIKSRPRLWFTTGTLSLPGAQECPTLESLLETLAGAIHEQEQGRG